MKPESKVEGGARLKNQERDLLKRWFQFSDCLVDDWWARHPNATDEEATKLAGTQELTSNGVEMHKLREETENLLLGE